jgi:predicted oxidoreductase
LGITALDTAAIYGGGKAGTLLGDALALGPALRDGIVQELIASFSH